VIRAAKGVRKHVARSRISEHVGGIWTWNPTFGCGHVRDTGYLGRRWKGPCRGVDV
jgi:hypothetical protein